ncbi:MAG: murein biosynthesis integral membrane protein MurJ [Anaerolineaceae bacterium]|jgi:putative peptidoglycan lipid II flippase|nr:murein biosynthesis integral membrane protein MurJ [Anaerolineaceae bacterium]
MTNIETENTQDKSANRQIARAAGTVMIPMVLSQLMGLLAKTLTARAFGTGLESDAIFAANRFSEIIFNLVAGGALGSAFIPTFTGLLVNEKRKEAWRLASSIANLMLLVMTVIAALSAIFAPWIVRNILALGFDAETSALTTQLMRIQLLSSVIFGLSGLLMGILNAHQSFLLPALAPAFYQLGWVFGALFVAPRYGVYGMSWSIVAGACMHLLVQLPALFRLPERAYHFSLGLKMPAVREVGRLMAPRLLGVGVVQLNFLLNTNLASLMPQGSYTGITLAFPIMLMPEIAIAQSIAIAALPTFSAQVARGRKDHMRTSLAASLRGALLLAIPASVGLVLLRQPVVALLYQRGEFGPESTAIVAWALLWYAAGLVGHSVVEIISRAFYALHDTKTPVVVGILTMGLNLVLSLLFTRLFNIIGWMPHGGLALANSLATFLEMICLLIIMRRRLEGIDGELVWQSVRQAGIGAAVMGVVIWAWMGLSAGWSVLVIVTGGLALGVGAYTLLLVVQRTPEVGELWGIAKRKILR